jgi:hypothetical protein
MGIEFWKVCSEQLVVGGLVQNKEAIVNKEQRTKKHR